MEPILRQLKITQMALLTGVAFYVAIGEAAGPKKGEPLQVIILAGGLSLWGAFSCFWIRRRLVFSYGAGKCGGSP
jgi:hypothetical protein